MSEHIQNRPPSPRSRIDVALPDIEIARAKGAPPPKNQVSWPLWFALVAVVVPAFYLESYGAGIAVAVIVVVVWSAVPVWRTGVFTWQRAASRPLRLYLKGRCAEAASCFDAMLARADSRYTSDDYRRGFTLALLADYAAHAARFDRAAELYQEGLRILCGAIEKQPFEYFYCLNNYASMLLNQKADAKAHALLELAVDVARCYDWHERVSLTGQILAFNLAHALIALKRYEEVEGLIVDWQALLANKAQAHAGLIRDVAEITAAKLCCARGRYDEALHRCDSVRRKVLANVARAQALLGLKRRAEAAQVAQQALAMRDYAPNHPVWIEYQLVLAESLLGQGDPAAAERWRAQARAIAEEHGLLDQPIWLEAEERWRTLTAGGVQ